MSKPCCCRTANEKVPGDSTYVGQQRAVSCVAQSEHEHRVEGRCEAGDVAAWFVPFLQLEYIVTGRLTPTAFEV